MKLKYVDLHCHTTLHPFAKYQTIDEKDKKDRDKVSLWEQIRPFKKDSDGRAIVYTQSDFKSMTKGGVKVALTAMYAFEQGWFELIQKLSPKEQKRLMKHLDQNEITNLELKRKSVVKVDKEQKYMVESGLMNLIKKFIWVFKVTHEGLFKRIFQIIQPDYNYFDQLCDELKFLKDKCIEKKGIYPTIPETNKDLHDMLNDESKLIIIPTIEGGAGFIDGNAANIVNGKVNFGRNIYDENGDIISRGVLDNIEKIKNKYNIFFVTLSHHFYSGFCGQAQSIYGFGRDVIDQMFGKGNVISQEGQKIIASLLGIGEFKGNGHRVLIDTKHNSLSARMQYCMFIEQYNKANPDDIIPIISSHSAFSGQEKIDNIGIIAGENSPYEVNIATEEIVAIYNSKGLIGVNFDQDVLSEKPKNEGTKNWTAEDWAGLVADNLLGMVKSFIDYHEKIDKDVDIRKFQDIWNLFTIGSDFDGIIKPMDDFPTAQEFPEFEQALINVLPTKEGFNKYSFDILAKELVEKFMGQNAIAFLKANYMKETIEKDLPKEAVNVEEKPEENV